jgi:beta-phosphoglucomutase-like phosphatase (HAD superfamily)
MDGARDALKYFNVPDAEERAQEYADRKQATVLALIDAGDFRAYPDALRFVLAVKAAGVPTAAASSSKNAGMLLRQIRLDTFAEQHGLDSNPIVRSGLTLLDAFDVDVSGRNFAHGKPHPDIFLAAAEELRVPPTSCFVVEDAPNGVQAAKAGQMSALGVARAGDADLLKAQHADLVVLSLDEVDITELAAGRLHSNAAR